MSNQSTIGSLSIIQSLSRAWESVKENLWLFGGFSMIYFIVSSIVGFMPIVGNASSLLSFVYTAAIFSALKVNAQKPSLDFSDFFSWSPKFGRLFLGNLLLLLLVLVILIPFMILIVAIIGFEQFTELTNQSDAIESFFVGSTVFVIVMAILLFIIIVSIALFAYPYIIQFTDMSFGAALKYSFKIGRNNIGQVVIFAFLSVALLLLGLLCLGVGLFFTVPVIVATQYHFLHDMISDKEAEVPVWDFMKESKD